MQLVRNLYTATARAAASLATSARSARPSSPRSSRTAPRPRGQGWILTQYLNNVPYGTVGGQTAVGVQAAARIFFDKPAARADAAEAALLAGLPQAPSHYNPFLDPQRARASAATRCCSEMADAGLHHPGDGRRAPSAAPLGVNADRLLRRAPRELLLRLRQAAS